jgi:hypothetical protein
MRVSIHLAFFICLLMFLGQVGPADAGVEWCSADPIIYVGTTAVDITLYVPVDNRDDLMGPALFSVTLPYDHPPVAVVVVPNGYFDQQVEVATGPTPWRLLGNNTLEVSVRVPSRRHFPIRVSVAGTDGLRIVGGFSNQPLNLSIDSFP